MPYALRRTLVDSNQWGAVRVLPGQHPGAELLLTGRILQSDGATLSIRLRAHDSRGREWINQVYTATAADTAYLIRVTPSAVVNCQIDLSPAWQKGLRELMV